MERPSRKQQSKLVFEVTEEGFLLKDVLLVTDLPEATYHYHFSKKDEPNKEKELEDLILKIFKDSKETYGYRRITLVLKAKGHHINHKRVYRIMKKIGIQCVKFSNKKRRYNSYKGKVGKVAKNRLKRRFDTPIPLQKLVTDVTEFKCLNDKKLYLSPIMDLYNREVISYKISKRPTLDLAVDPLKEAISIIEQHAPYRATIHSDQGWHYQHNSWVKALKENKIFQSMSRKGNCIDNSPMENFFGLLKQEMYHGEETVSYTTLKNKIEDYIHDYNTKRIKEKLSGLSPVEYRKQDTQLAA
ncbi:MAG: IS3 family transposase [Alkalibacterium sp.]|nr:IS3 family transposase [Alkalibacterium sp.]MDN6363790.1 IS3 family transposase [Tetragenococcus koreensis]MDN6398825.1 IS3 family transposase [Alkalibacterium sp.]